MMMAEVGILPGKRYRNAIRPWETLPNGQIVDDSTGLVETLEAVQPNMKLRWQQEKCRVLAAP